MRLTCSKYVLNYIHCITVYIIFLQVFAITQDVGGPEKLKLERFVEALSDPSSGLTYPALTGSRKQSVVDAECFFNPDLVTYMSVTYMSGKGYDYEADFVKTICNWRRACDERGLSERERSKFNYYFLNMILDELMPWLKDMYDFSL